MALFGSSSSAPAPAPTPAKDQLQAQIAQELAIANATELVTKITENCFAKCIDTPQDTITAPQSRCVDQCLEKYMRSWNVISKTYVSRIQLEKQ